MGIELFDDNMRRSLLAVAPKLENIIRGLISAEKIAFHSVTSRVKERESLSKKMQTKERYDLETFTDLLGLRIIAYFSSDAHDIAKIVEQEFKIDHENSMDKQAAMEPDQFGYASIHYVAEMNSPRVDLRENYDCQGVVFEIQIRSLLQHTWAEIQHDLGYKSELEVPRDVRRRFSRLAGMLEMADDEFVQLRKVLQESAQQVTESVKSGQLSLELTRDSIYAYTCSSGDLSRLEMLLAEKSKGNFAYAPESEPGLRYAGENARMLRAVGIGSISELDNIIRNDSERLVDFGARWLLRPDLVLEAPGSDIRELPRGFGLLYVFYVKLIELGGEKGEKWATSILNNYSFNDSLLFGKLRETLE